MVSRWSGGTRTRSTDRSTVAKTVSLGGGPAVVPVGQRRRGLLVDPGVSDGVLRLFQPDLDKRVGLPSRVELGKQPRRCQGIPSGQRPEVDRVQMETAEPGVFGGDGLGLPAGRSGKDVPNPGEYRTRSHRISVHGIEVEWPKSYSRIDQRDQV